MKSRVLIVDDEPTARISLAEILQLEGYHVAVAEDGGEALRMLEREPFDVVVLDIKMPGVDGVEVLKRAPKIAPESRIILLTAHGSLESAIEAVRQGAHDYLLKPASPGDILASISRALSGFSDSERRRKLIEQLEGSLQQLKEIEGLEPGPPGAAQILALGDGILVDLERREIWQGDRKVQVTPAEGRLLHALIENRGRVMSHRELVQRVQGYQTTDWDAPEILRPLVSRLRRKLAVFPDGRRWIASVRSTGYVFDGEEN